MDGVHELHLQADQRTKRGMMEEKDFPFPLCYIYVGLHSNQCKMESPQ